MRSYLPPLHTITIIALNPLIFLLVRLVHATGARARARARAGARNGTRAGAGSYMETLWFTTSIDGGGQIRLKRGRHRLQPLSDSVCLQ